MPGPEFSEFAYGYACIREAEIHFDSAGGLVAAPELPSLLEEESIGYDAALYAVDFALFLQFKTSYFVSRKHPRDCYPSSPHIDGCTWANLGTPHFRFEVDTAGHQQRRLLELEALIRTEQIDGRVWYVAPAFSTQDALSSHYRGGSVLSTSTILSPTSLAGPPPGKHKVAHGVAGTQTLVLSEATWLEEREEWPPRPIFPGLSGESDEDSQRRQATLADLVAIVSRVTPQTTESLSFPNPVRQLRYLAGLMGVGIVVTGHLLDSPLQ